MSQQHQFISYIKNKHSFKLVIFGMAIIITWNINFSQYLNITFADFIMIQKFLLSLKLKKVQLTINNMLLKLIINFVLSFSLKKIIVNMNMNQIMNFIFNLKMLKMQYIIVINLLIKLKLLTIKIPKIIISGIPIVAKFYLLWEYDNKKLWEIDNIALIDLDYIIA
jgi:hypothetical protein